MMLQCPKCLTLARQSSPSVSSSSPSFSSSIMASSQTSPLEYPLYQNCHHSIGHRSPDEEIELLAELRRLRVKVLQNQLEQARLEEKLMSSVHCLHVRSVSTHIEERLERSRLELEQSCWYYGAITWQESAMLLQDTNHGTFLVRDSQDNKFLYTLSLQRSKEGPTSVRVAFRDGKFSLDAEPAIRRMMPEFASIGSLIVAYCSEQRTEGAKANIVIRKPLYRRPPSLAHSARIIINKRLREQSCSSYTQLHLPPKLVDYLRSYTLTI